MKEFISNFSERELASVSWVLIIFFGSLFKAGIRKSYWDVQSVLFSKPILIIGFIFIFYTGTEIWLLKRAGIWFLGSEKEVLFWILFSAIPSIGLFSKVDDANFFSTYLKSLFAFTVFVEFVNSSYTYSFWVEFFLVLPALTFLGLLIASNMQVVKSDWAGVFLQKILSWLFSIVGFVLAFNAIRLFIADFDNLTFKAVAFELLTPLILSIGFLPFIYSFSVYIKLENIYGPLKLFVKAKRPLFLMWKIFKELNFSVPLVEKWKDRILRFGLRSHNELMIEALNLKKYNIVQKESKYLPLKEGWGIGSSRFYLKDFELAASDYKQEEVDSESWFACSPYLYIGEDLINNNLAYYINGSSDTVKEMKIIANFNNAEFAIETKEVLIRSIVMLVYKSMYIELPEALIAQIKLENDFEQVLLDKRLVFVKDIWPAGKGYHLSFSISDS